VAAHIPGLCGRRSASEREDHSHRDALVVHDVQLLYQPHNTMNNINAVDCTTKYRGIWFSLNGDTLYHEKQWKVLFLRFHRM
jgi:hypothetical protein